MEMRKECMLVYKVGIYVPRVMPMQEIKIASELIRCDFSIIF